jgi:hypothetical protein
LSILNISEIVADKIDQQSITNGSALSYFFALCRRPIPGPLAGGSAAAKDVNKWLDDIIGSYESSVREFQGGEVQKLLISLLKISYQHYGKLRSPFGPDPSREVFTSTLFHLAMFSLVVSFFFSLSSIIDLVYCKIFMKTINEHHCHTDNPSTAPQAHRKYTRSNAF